jgi:hypothetical protein
MPSSSSLLQYQHQQPNKPLYFIYPQQQLYPSHPNIYGLPYYLDGDNNAQTVVPVISSFTPLKEFGSSGGITTNDHDYNDLKEDFVANTPISLDEEHGGNSTILPINSSIQNFMEYYKESASSEDTVNTPPSSKSFEWSAPLSDLTKNSSSSSSSSILKRTILDNEKIIQIHIARIEFLNDELNLADTLGLDISEINTITKEIEYLNKSMADKSK